MKEKQLFCFKLSAASCKLCFKLSAAYQHCFVLYERRAEKQSQRKGLGKLRCNGGSTRGSERSSDKSEVGRLPRRTARRKCRCSVPTAPAKAMPGQVAREVIIRPGTRVPPPQPAGSPWASGGTSQGADMGVPSGVPDMPPPGPPGPPPPGFKKTIAKSATGDYEGIQSDDINESAVVRRLRMITQVSDFINGVAKAPQQRCEELQAGIGKVMHTTEDYEAMWRIMGLNTPEIRSFSNLT